MKSKQSLNMDKKSAPQNIRRKYQCPCILFYLSITKDKTQEQFSKTSEKETHNTETAKKSSGKSTVLKINKKSHITRIPKIGCDIPFLVTLFTSLSNTGSVTMDERGIMNAVNIVARAKKDLDEGKKWNGTIEINENLKLKLYKSGLGLYHKK